MVVYIVSALFLGDSCSYGSGHIMPVFDTLEAAESWVSKRAHQECYTITTREVLSQHDVDALVPYDFGIDIRGEE